MMINKRVAVERPEPHPYATKSDICFYINPDHRLSAVVSNGKHRVTLGQDTFFGFPKDRLNARQVSFLLTHSSIRVQKDDTNCPSSLYFNAIGVGGGNCCFGITIAPDREPVFADAAARCDISFFKDRQMLTVDEHTDYQALQEKKKNITPDEKLRLKTYRQNIVPADKIRRFRIETVAFIIGACVNGTGSKTDIETFVNYILETADKKPWLLRVSGTPLVTYCVEHDLDIPFNTLLYKFAQHFSKYWGGTKWIAENISKDIKMGMFDGDYPFNLPEYAQVIQAFAKSIVLDKQYPINQIDLNRMMIAGINSPFFTLSVLSRVNAEVARFNIQGSQSERSYISNYTSGYYPLADHQFLTPCPIYARNYGENRSARILFMTISYVSTLITSDEDCKALMGEKIPEYFRFLLGTASSGGLGLHLDTKIDIGRSHSITIVHSDPPVERGVGDNRYSETKTHRIPIDVSQMLTVSARYLCLLPEFVIENSLFYKNLIGSALRDSRSTSDFNERKRTELTCFTRNKLFLIDLLMTVDPSMKNETTAQHLVNYFILKSIHLRWDGYKSNSMKLDTYRSEYVNVIKTIETDWRARCEEWGLRNVVALIDLVSRLPILNSILKEIIAASSTGGKKLNCGFLDHVENISEIDVL